MAFLRPIKPLSVEENKDKWYAKVKADEMSLRMAPDEIKSDKDIVRLALAYDGRLIAHTSDELRKDKDIVTMAVENGASLLQVPFFDNDIDIVEKCISTCPHHLKHTSSSIRNNEDLMKRYIKEYKCSLEFLSAELKDNKEIVMSAVANNGSDVQYISKRLQKDLEVVNAAIQATPMALEHLLPEMRNNFDVVLTAVTLCGDSIKYASPELQCNDTIIRAALSEDNFVKDSGGFALYYIPDTLLEEHPEYIILALKQSDTNMQFVPEKLRTKEAVLAGLSFFPRATYSTWIPFSFQNDYDCMIEALSISPEAIKYASEELLADPEFVRAALFDYGCDEDYYWFNKEIIAQIKRSRVKSANTAKVHHPEQ